MRSLIPVRTDHRCCVGWFAGPGAQTGWWGGMGAGLSTTVGSPSPPCQDGWPYLAASPGWGWTAGSPAARIGPIVGKAVTDHTIRSHFDRSFYDHYYRRRPTAVVAQDDVDRLARFVLSYMKHLRLRVRTVLDAGCGVGLWRDALRAVDPSIEYTGVERSEYAARTFGWVQSSIADFRSRRKFDLVVCQDVLQYLSGAEVEDSVETMARLCRGALYVQVPTREDVERGVLDLRRSDRRIHVRRVGWYRRILDRCFVAAGGGVFIPSHSRTALLALEHD